MYGQQLDTLHEHIGAMRVRCDEAQAQLQETNDACRALLDRAGSLREQRYVSPSALLPFFPSTKSSSDHNDRQEISTRQTILTLFLARFTLAPDEAEAIASREVPVGSRFFAAMDKAGRVREDCRVLMAGEDGPTKAG